MNTELLKGLNEHLKLEFRAAHEYLAMSVWLSAHDLPGFSTVDAPAVHRRADARAAHHRPPARARPGARPAGDPGAAEDWKSLEALCAHVLRNEQEVTASINDLYAMAEKAKDRPATVMLQWFVSEQMEEEASARAVLGRIRLAGNTGVGLLMVDQELATGKVPGMPAEPAAGGLRRTTDSRVHNPFSRPEDGRPRRL